MAANAYAPANAYKNQQILTAAPEDLVLMLYNGALRFIKESMLALDEKNMVKSHKANMRAQAIVDELRYTLDMQYEIAKKLSALYEYIKYRLVDSNMKKEKNGLEEAYNMITELRDTWSTAIKKMRMEKSIGRTSAEALA